MYNFLKLFFRSPIPHKSCSPCFPPYDDRLPRVLDVIGCQREISLCGHVSLIRRLPIRLPEHRALLDQFLIYPGNYEGRYHDHKRGVARILDYGNSYVALRICDDVTRPEVGEFLLSRGWKMIGFTSKTEGDKTYVMEKWCNIRDH